MFIKVSGCAAHVYLFFTSRKNSLFCTRRHVPCKLFISKVFRRPCAKNNISGYIWHKLFIQTVKCSFLSHIIVYQSFYGTLLTFSYFLLQGKVLCFARVSKSLVRCLFLKLSEDLVEKIISQVIIILIQIVHSNSKMLLLFLHICLSKFLWLRFILKGYKAFPKGFQRVSEEFQSVSKGFQTSSSRFHSDLKPPRKRFCG